MNKNTLTLVIISIIFVLVVGFVIYYFFLRDNIVCDKPYMRFGKDCCLDQNNNKICDMHETTSSDISKTSTTLIVKSNVSVIVSRVIDGDTVEIASGERVRLLGMNTPELGQPYHDEAANRLKEFVEGKSVTLESDINEKDQYGRLLRYVYVDEKFVNAELVKEGYANVYILPPNTKHEAELRAAWKECRKIKIRLCGSSPSYCDETCIGILNFNWNAEGNDCDNLNDEYVTFKNTCSYSCNLTKWTIKDEGNNVYTFPEFTLGEVATLTLYTGCGTNTGTKVYWCNSGKECNSIWNNDGDTLYLRNANGELVIDYNYKGF